MTSALRKAFEKASALPPEEQDVLAEQILADLDEAKWDEAFGNSQDLPEKMPQEALKHREEGRTVEKGWDEI